MMKLLIVDDEPLVRNGLLHFIEWSDYGVEVTGTAGNGVEAMDMVKCQTPDIVMTDIRMPGMDGLELGLWLRSHYPQIYVIFLTGFSEFEYVRSALKLEASEYLLKPVDEKVLCNILKIIDGKLSRKRESEQETLRLRKILEQSMPIMRERLVSDWLNQRMTIEDIHARMDFCELNLHGRYYFVALIEVEPGIPQNDGFISSELCWIRAKEIVDAGLEFFRSRFVFIDIQYVIAVLCFDDLEEMDQYQSVLGALESIRRNANRDSIILTIGASRQHEGVDSLPLCYDEAVKALDQKVCLGKDLVIPSRDMDSESAGGIYLYNRNQVIRMILCNNLKGIEEWLGNYFCFYRDQQDMDSRKLQFLHYELAFILLEAARETGIQERSTTGMKDVTSVSYKTLDEMHRNMLDLFSGMMEQILLQRNKRSSKNIEEVKKYIDSNYMKDIDLKIISKKFYINTSYLSRLFSIEANTSFSEYLTSCRVNKAIELMKDPNLKIYSISEMVGYNCEKYFARVFKKVMGISPHEYREKQS